MTSADNLALLGRVMGALIVVLVLVGLAARVARRARGHAGTTGLRVIDRVGLSREASLSVVEVADRVLLLGVTAQGVTMLADLDPAGARSTDREVDRQVGRKVERLIDREVDRVGFATAAEAAPEAFPDGGPSQRRPIPTGVALDEFPDLASALRAAGRTSEPEHPTTTSEPRVAATAIVMPGEPAGAPRTRAEARAEARARAAADAQAADQAVTRGAQGGPAWSASREVDRIPAQRGQSETKKRLLRPIGQASGSVLSPRTWRQGIEALRDLTVRRG